MERERPMRTMPDGQQARTATTPATMPSTTVRVPQWAYPTLTAISLLLGATSIVRGTRGIVSAEDSDLTNFFFKSANFILTGHPFQIYAARGSGLTATYPNFNPPLSLFVIAPLLRLARAFGFAANYGEQITFVSLPFLVFVPLLGWLALRVLRMLYPEMPEAQRLLAFALITLSPLTWQSYSPWYHLEQPMMLCLLVGALLALQRQRLVLAGVLAGLAVLTRTTALMPLLALGILLLANRSWRPLVTFGGVAALCAAVGFAPFFLADPHDTSYSLVSWRGTAIIGGNSIWTIFAAGDGATGIRHSIDALARRLDTLSVIVVLAVIAYLAVRRLGATAFGSEAWAVAAIAALTVPMLSKTNWPYYYLEPFALLVIWEFATMHDRRPGLWRWPVVSVIFLCVAGTLSQYIGLRSVGAFDRISVGVVEFGAMAAFAAAIWLRLAARKPVDAAATSGALGGGAPATPAERPRLVAPNVPGTGPTYAGPGWGGGSTGLQGAPAMPTPPTTQGIPSSQQTRPAFYPPAGDTRAGAPQRWAPPPAPPMPPTGPSERRGVPQADQGMPPTESWGGWLAGPGPDEPTRPRREPPPSPQWPQR